jgi:hypothetical protein
MTKAEWLAGTDPTPMVEFLRGKASGRKLRLFAVGGAFRFRDVIDQDDRFPDLLDHAIGVARWFADGLTDRGELDAARRTVLPVPDLPPGYADDDWWIVYAAAAVTDPDPFDAAARVARLLVRIGEFAWAQANTMVISGLACVNSREELGEMIRRQRRKWEDAGRASPVPGSWETLYANWDAVRDASPWGRDAIRFREGELTALVRDIFGNPFRRVGADPSWLTSTTVSLARSIYKDCAFDRLPILADALEEAGCDDADVLNHLRGDGLHVRGCWAVDLVLGRE